MKNEAQDRNAALLDVDRLFALCTAEDEVNAQSEINKLREEAKALRCLSRFEEALRVAKKAAREEAKRIKEERDAQTKAEYARLMSAENTIQYSNLPDGVPPEMECGEWDASDDGVWRWGRKGGELTPVYACSRPILPTAFHKDASTREVKVTVSCCIDGRNWESVTVNQKTISTSRGITDLAAYGFPVTDETAPHLVSFFQKVIDRNRGRIPQTIGLNQMGWLNEKEFLPFKMETDSPYRFIGNGTQLQLHNACTQRGSIEAWFQGAAGRLYGENKIVRLVVAASVASVLLSRTGGQPFFVHLWGPTGKGKTVALKIAASVWGRASRNPDDPTDVSEGLLLSVNGTVNALCSLAATLNHLPCILDELQTMKDRKKDALAAFVMQMAQGRERARLGKDATLKESPTWQNVILVNGEEPICKEDTTGGVVNRTLEIHAGGSIFQPNEVREVLECIEKNHGVVGAWVVDAIANQYNRESLKKQIGAFAKKIAEKKPGAEGKQIQLGAHILLADSILMADYGIHTGNWSAKPMPVEWVSDLLVTPKETDPAARARELILSLPTRYPTRFNGGDAEREVWGLPSREVDGEIYVPILATVVQEQLKENGFDYRACSAAWARDGFILTDSEGKYTKKVRICGNQARAVWMKIDAAAEEEK